MCEFKVVKNGEIVFRDAIYAKTDGNNINVRDVLGISKIFENCRITEIDVGLEHLLLTDIQK